MVPNSSVRRKVVLLPLVALILEAGLTGMLVAQVFQGASMTHLAGREARRQQQQTEKELGRGTKTMHFLPIAKQSAIYQVSAQRLLGGFSGKTLM